MKELLRLIFSFLMLWVAPLNAEVHIEITQGMNLARPIGIIPFQWEGPGSEPEDIASIVATDLRNSGKFNPVDCSRSSQQPYSAQKMQSTKWSRSDIDTIVSGQLTLLSDGSYNVSYRLINTNNVSGTVLAQNSYKVNKQWLRYAGHAASDEVFEKLTGIKGAFRTRIAYVVKTNRDQFPYELRVSDYDGYNQFIVQRSSQPLMSPAWSPDGSRLAYVTFESGRSALVMQTLSTGTVRQIAAFPRHNGAPAFSPDGTKLAFALSKTGSLNLYVMDIESEQIHQLTDGRSNNTEPSWFPDSQNLVFTSDQTGRPQIYKININERIPQRITWEGLQNQGANVSADGKTMVMVTTTSGQQRIAKQDLLMGRVQILSSTFLDETPSLAPNGAMIIYSSSQGRGSVLNLISADGRFKSSLPTTDEQVKSPAWSPYL